LGNAEDDEDEIDQEMQDQAVQHEEEQGRKGFRWTRKLQQQFKREFEKLAILDYLIRNTGGESRRKSYVSDKGWGLTLSLWHV
jgi:hypothetical protein